MLVAVIENCEPNAPPIASNDPNKPLPLLFQQMKHLLNKNYYYMIGIIDFLQEYNMKKKAERLIKGVKDEVDGISVCPPDQYAQRFCNFIERVLKMGHAKIDAVPVEALSYVKIVLVFLIY